MSSRTAADLALPPADVRPRSAVHVLALGLVWLTFATGSIVFAEPAPYDVLMMGLIFALPLVRLADLTPRLMVCLGIWFVIAAGGIVASTLAVGISTPLKHTVITLYLSVSAVLVAAFVHTNPERHARLVLSGYTAAAVIAAAAGLVGYFGALPGAFELFTEYGRARGPFKDANVLGPFLVPVLLYAVHQTVFGTAARALVATLVAPLLLFCIFITFSRGAWLNAAVSLLVYAFMAFATAPSHLRRLKLTVFALLGVGVAVAVVAAALQVTEIADLFGERAQLTQSYDVGRRGRFGGQMTAMRVILDNPLGIGALEFGKHHHAEDTHNVYLSMFLNAGWLGGLLFLALTIATLINGFSNTLRGGPNRGIAVVTFSAFVGVAVQGLLVDTDHWRHLFVLMGLIWGLTAVRRDAGGTESRIA